MEKESIVNRYIGILSYVTIGINAIIQVKP
jgi:hypothetical protein